MLKSAVPSPCVRNCCLDRSDICVGCGRHLAEIQHWQQASDEQKLQIIATAEARLAERDRLRKQQRDNPLLRPH